MTNLKIFILRNRNSENGYVMISSLMVIVLVTIIGVMSVRTSNSDLEITTNQHISGRSFYAAEAAKAFVRADPVSYYGSNNIPEGPCTNATNFSCASSPQILYGSGTTGVSFPGTADSTKINIPLEGQANYYRPIILGEVNSDVFRGRVVYLKSTVPPRGSGNAVGKFKAHNYSMLCEGHGPRDSIAQIDAGFYRIGF